MAISETTDSNVVEEEVDGLCIVCGTSLKHHGLYHVPPIIEADEEQIMDNIELGHAESNELQLPQSDYGAEVRAMVAVLAQFRNLIGNLEGLLFNLQVYSHRLPDRPKPDPIATMDKGDFVETIPPRLVKGFTGICKGTEHVHTPANEREATPPGN